MKWISEEQLKGLKLSFEVKEKIISKRSKFQNIDIVVTTTHGKLLLLDNKVMLTEMDEFIYHEMISHVPLLSAKNPQNVLIIGGGDGGTARECLKYKNLKIDVCEIDKEVVDLSIKYLPFVGNSFKNKRVTNFFEDGFEFLKKIYISKKRYDVIIVDSSDPIGAASVLFENQFFELLKKCLTKNGVTCMQCESPFFHAETIKNVTKDLHHSFKNVKHYIATIPTYPFSLWTFAIASDQKIDTDPKNLPKFKTSYYNQEIHKASFALPNILKKLI